MGGVTGSLQVRIVALVVGSLAVLAMIIVGCSSVTEGTPTVNAGDAPVYKASVSASMA
jgi:PBP1b-binding outer membrane lipoprotein LpoB